MTEEIIIDGVDVSGCDFYELCGCIENNHEINECKDNPDCYYKQLKRLEQENKELKSALEKIRDINKLFFERKYGYPEDLIEIDNIINEVLDNESN